MRLNPQLLKTSAVSAIPANNLKLIFLIIVVRFMGYFLPFLSNPVQR